MVKGGRRAPKHNADLDCSILARSGYTKHPNLNDLKVLGTCGRDSRAATDDDAGPGGSAVCPKQLVLESKQNNRNRKCL